MKTLPLSSPSFQYVKTAFQQWLDVLGYAPTTVYQLPNYVHEFLHYLEKKGKTQVHQIDTPLIKTYYRQLKTRHNHRRGGGLSNTYLNKHQQALCKFTQYLRESGRLLLPDLYLSREHNDSLEVTTLSPQEIQALYKATYGFNENTNLAPMNARDRAMLTIFYSCGLRRNEGYHLNLSDINYDRQVLHVRKGKNKQERLIPFTRANGKYLEDYQYNHRPLMVKNLQENAFFISQRGKRMETQSMALRLRILQQRTDDITLQNKNVRLHVLRHSIATHLLQNGMDLEKIARFLGHTSLESTQLYTHLAEAENTPL